MFSVNTPVVSLYALTRRQYGVVVETTDAMSGGQWLTVLADDGERFTIHSEDAAHRTLTLNGSPHFFNVDAVGQMHLWYGEPEDVAPKSIGTMDTFGVDVWLTLWGMTD